MAISIIDITERPLQLMGLSAGICWNSDVDDPQANVKRAIACIYADHGRVLEYPSIILEISGESARMFRELYTHIGGAPTRLQDSTRFVDASNFKYYTPPSCKKDGVKEVYEKGMQSIADFYGELIDLGVPREDAANALPLGMNSKVVWKINLRTLVNFMNKRLCGRALLEIQKFSHELRDLLMQQNDEWLWIGENLFVPSCERFKLLNPSMCFCIEKKCCGRHPYIKDVTLVKQ